MAPLPGSVKSAENQRGIGKEHRPLENRDIMFFREKIDFSHQFK